MSVRFHSVVLITNDFEVMKRFYHETLQQKILTDFGSCISFENGLSLWHLKPEYEISKKLGKTFDLLGNSNIELCFETDDFDVMVSRLKPLNLKYLHDEIEELWGQRTIRFYDPENNLVELGETISCFVKRFYHQGMSISEVAKRTSVPEEMVKSICER